MTMNTRILFLTTAALLTGCGGAGETEQPLVDAGNEGTQPATTTTGDADIQGPSLAIAAADTLAGPQAATGDTLALVDALKMVLATASTPAELHGKLGRTYFRSGQFDKAADAFRLALNAEPTNIEFQVGMARALNRGTGDEAAVRAALDELVAKFPDAAHLRIERAKTFRRAGEIETALEELQAAIELSDGDPTAQVEYHLTMGRKLRMDRDEEKAVAEYKSALSLDPDNAQATLGLHLTETKLHTRKGDHDAAVEAARRAVDADPTSTQALYAYHSAMGKQLKDRGQYEEAITEFIHCSELAPTSAGAANALGSIYLVAKRFDDAATHLKRAIEIEPRHLGAHHGLAKAYERLQWHELARETWAKVLELDEKGRYEQEARLHIEIIDQIGDLSAAPEGATAP
ncbi:MAG: hypothetical protein CME06_15270 [Gemmatimonadetes bacterium]|nr:hypothetical protein [Gemmatimonadota bacterium]